MQSLDGIPKRAKSTADLPVTALAHGNYPFIPFIVITAHKVELATAILELDAKITNHLLVERFEIAIKPNMVHLGFRKTGVGHPKGKVAVVTE